MYKIISAIFLIVFGAVVNGEDQNVDTYSNYNNNSNYNSSFRTDEYININRRQYAKNIQDYDNQMEIFKQSYAASLNTINIQQDMLVDALVQTNDKLDPLAILSDSHQECVNEYRTSIPTEAATKALMNGCVATANNQLNSMLSNPLNTRSYLDSYYKNNFEKDISSCQKTYNSLPLNYTICIESVVTTTNSYTVTNQKTFATQMDAAQCSATANSKKASECSFTAQYQTIYAIAEANTYIYDCIQCSLFNTCSKVQYMKSSDVNYSSETIANPFYGRSDITDCLLLKIIS